MRGTLKEDTEKPSTKFFVSTGTRSPASVVIRLAVSPITSASFGILVDKIREINGFKLPLVLFNMQGSNPSILLKIECFQ